MTEKRDFTGMKARRLEAAKLLAEGMIAADVARRLDVSRQSVSRWQKALKKSGKKGLEGSGRVGRPQKLSEADMRKVERALIRGTRANGIDADLWTLARVRKVIETITGQHYGISGAWYVLRRLGWSAQRPAKQAAERNQKDVDRWMKETWPALKKTPDEMDP